MAAARRCALTPPVFHLPAAELTGTAGGGALPPGAQLVLDGAEGRHASTVRRLEPGETVHVTDGEGRRAVCSVVSAGAGRVELQVRDLIEEAPPAPRLVVVQALAKGDRGEQAVELLTEVGADVIIPWAAARCIVQWRDERGDRALRRWRSTAHEAAKQSRRARWPEVTAPATTVQVAARLAAAALPVVLHEDAAQALAAAAPPESGDLVVVVGPEGGITEEELHTFAAAGAGTYRLGPAVMRTSTAGAAAGAVLLAGTRRWRG
jgi:16S rRNA (uracil1498-N3)-methyltransferase